MLVVHLPPQQLGLNRQARENPHAFGLSLPFSESLKADFYRQAAIIMATPPQKKVSHPLFVMGGVNIVESVSPELMFSFSRPATDLCHLFAYKLSNTVKEGHQYGQFNYVGSIRTAQAGETNVCVEVSSYGSADNALSPNTAYVLMGRLVQTNPQGLYHFFFEHALSIKLGPSTQFASQGGWPSPLVGKVAAFSYGLILEKVEITKPDNPNVNGMRVKMAHTDYHNMVRSSHLYLCSHKSGSLASRWTPDTSPAQFRHNLQHT